MTNNPVAAACAHWGLRPDGPPIQTPTSTVQRVIQQDGSPAVVKCLTLLGRDERPAIPLLRWYDGGASVRLLDAGDDAMLLEWLSGRPLTTLVKAGHDTQAAQILATVCRDLHTPRTASVPVGLQSVTDRFQPLRDAAATDPLHSRAAAAAANLLATGPNAIPLHGDLHHTNILADATGTWRAIDPKGLIGDPHYDLATALCNPIEFPGLVRDPVRAAAMAGTLADATGLDAARVLAYAACHACLSGLWCLQDGVDPGHSQAMARILDALVNP